MKADLTWMRKDFIVIIPSFKCNISCDHCQHSCSSDREERMPLELFCSCINQALDLGWKQICLSGGEPFLIPEYIESAAKICRERNAKLIIQTNGFWGKNLTHAKLMLEKMKGITQIGFSIDKSHLKEIKLDYVLDAINAAVESGINSISISISYQTFNEFEVLEKSFLKSYPGIQIVGWPICPIGRAKEHPELRIDFFEYDWSKLQRNCDSQLRMIPVIHPNGDFHPCYRTVMVLEQNDPLIIGNIKAEKIYDIITNIENKLYLFTIAFGGGGLGYLFQDSPYEKLLKDNFQGICHFCYNVFSNKEAVSYLEELLNTGTFDKSILHGLERSQKSWKTNLNDKKERILICDGSNCGQRHQTYPIIHYLCNELVEQKKRHLVDVELVNCLNSCKTGPNIYLQNQKQLITKVNLSCIDKLVKNI